MMSKEESIKAIEISDNITSIANGAIYELPKLQFNVPNVFTSLAFTDSLVIKTPASAWLKDFYRYVRIGEPSPYSGYPLARLANDDEKNVEILLAKFPEFLSSHNHHPEHTHFLLVHILQHERLKNYTKIKIPQSRFILVQRNRFWFFKGLIPTIIQEKVPGIPLLEMYDQNNRTVKQHWIQYLNRINPILRDLLNSDIRNHLNWYIRNFLYDCKNDVLWYVDPKPTCIFLRHGNEKNIQSLKEIFFRYF